MKKLDEKFDIMTEADYPLLKEASLLLLQQQQLGVFQESLLICMGVIQEVDVKLKIWDKVCREINYESQH